MIEKDSVAVRELLAFLLCSLLSLAGGAALVAVRFVLTDRFFYFFLIWNLVLALAPYGISVALFIVSRRRRRPLITISTIILALLWLVFYPNAPYIFTDFIHIANKTFVRSGTSVLKQETLLWYDLTLCSAFAFLGHAVGLFSIDLVFRALKGLFRPLVARLLVAVAIIISGFGIYIGRFVRLNSWDLFVRPFHTAKLVFPYLSDFKAVLISGVFSAFIIITYGVHHLTRKASVIGR